MLYFAEKNTIGKTAPHNYIMCGAVQNILKVKQALGDKYRDSKGGWETESPA